MTDESHRRPGAVIFGCAGTSLDVSEAAFFRDADPIGFILFARNCENPEQVRGLVGDLRASVGRSDAPVLIDQEGGRVQRLGPPAWRNTPSARALVEMVEATDPSRLAEAVRLNAQLIAHDLSELGITVDCLPVLDIPQPGAHDIVGDRAFSQNAAQVSRLGRAACEGLLQGGVLPVIKHMPGHGRSHVDSHKDLPRVSARRDELEALDFIPFRALSDMPFAMTAHIIYEALDPNNVATQSRLILDDLVRKEFGFSGLILSDDLSMNALSGSIGERAQMSLAAGCDVVLHCNGDRAEMDQVAAAINPLSDAALERLERAEALRQDAKSSRPFHVEDALARLKGLCGGRL